MFFSRGWFCNVCGGGITERIPVIILCQDDAALVDVSFSVVYGPVIGGQ